MSRTKLLTKQDEIDKALRNEFNEFAKIIPIYRVLIMKELSLSPKTFKQLKLITKCSDGNLASHLRFIENEKLIRVEKGYNGRRPQTTYHLSSHGIKFWNHFWNELTTILSVTKLGVMNNV